MGSSMTRVVVGEFFKGEKNPKIVGAGESATFGMRHGYVVDSSLVTTSIKNAVALAEKASGFKIKRAFVSISGATLQSVISSGGAIVSKADSEVTALDINKALQDCEDNLNLDNKKIIHTYPQTFRLDGKEALGRLEGMSGMKLEAKTLFITYANANLEDLIVAIAEAGVETIDVIASPIAAGNIVLSDKQKIAGVALIDIGDQTTSLSVFENGLPISVHTFSIGSTEITNDIALGFKISLEQAEALKLGNEIWENSSSSKADQHKSEKKKLDEIVEARLCDIFESIENHLKKIKRAELLPAGAVFIGGGANTPLLAELSKSILKLPSSIGTTDIFDNVKTKLRDPSYFTAIGLLVSGKNNGNYSNGSLKNLFKDFKNTIKAGLKQLMP